MSIARGQNTQAAPEEGSCPRLPWPFTLAWAALTFSALFLSVELLRSHRSDYWAGGASTLYLGAAASAAVYMAALYMAGAGLAGLLRLLLRKPLGATWAVVTAAGAASLVWFTAVRFSDTPRSLQAAVAAAILGVFVLLAGAARRSPVAARSMARLLTTCFVATSLGIHCAADFFFLEADRKLLVTGAAVAWGVVAFAGLVILWLASGRGGRRLAGAACMVLIPPAFILTWPPLRTLVNPPPASGGPALVLISADALRADFCSLRGGSTRTPAIEALAARGCDFKRAYSLAPWTVPSFYGMLTSQYMPGLTPGLPKEQQDLEIASYRVPSDVETLAEHLRGAGFVTGGFVGNYFLGKRDGGLRGMRYSRSIYHYVCPKTGFFAYCPFLQDVLSAFFPGAASERPVDSTRILMAHGAEFLRRNRGRPHFLWLHLMDPHDPYSPPPEFRTPERPDPDLGEWISFYINHEELTKGQKRYIRTLYEDEIRYMDHAVGELLGGLRSLVGGERTYICFTSDHGEEFWDHGDWGHGQSVYQEQLWVPLVITGPGIAPRAVDEPFSQIDLAPTLAGLAGAPKTPGWKGRDLSGFLRGEGEFDVSPVFAHGTKTGVWQAAVEGETKIIRNGESGDMAFHDLEKDPGESVNAAEDNQAEAARFEAAIEKWLGSFPSTLSTSPDGASPEEVQENLDMLKGVGYL